MSLEKDGNYWYYYILEYKNYLVFYCYYTTYQMLYIPFQYTETQTCIKLYIDGRRTSICLLNLSTIIYIFLITLHTNLTIIWDFQWWRFSKIGSRLSVRHWRITKTSFVPSRMIQFVTMDVEYTWILRQGKNCRQFNLLTWNSFIGQFVYPVGGKEMG